MKEEKRLRDGAAAEPDADVSGERARVLAEHAAALLLEIDERGQTLYAGAGCTEILGYTPEELMSLSLLDLIHPKDRERVIAEYCEVQEHGVAQSVHRARHRDGHWCWMQDTVRAFCTPSGEQRFAVIGRDVTAQKELEAALEHQAQVEHSIAELSRHFLAVSHAEVDAEIHANLPVAAGIAGADRTVLIALNGGREPIGTFYEWTCPGGPREGPRRDAGALVRFRWSTRTLTRGEIINVANPDQLPSEASIEAEDMRRRGVRGLLGIPVRTGSTLIGYQLFETFEERPVWSPQEITQLRLVGEIFAGALQRRRTEQKMERRRWAEAQVAALSRRFLGLGVDEIDAAIEEALAEASDLAGAQRGYLFCFSRELGPQPAFYEWCAPGVASHRPREMEWSRRKILAGELLHIVNPAELPPEAEPERRLLEARGVRAVLGIPVLSGRTPIGFLAFECMERHREWSDHDVMVLRMVGDLFTAALRRRASEQALYESRAQLLQSQKLEAVGRLAGGIAHDFNNLLTVILGFSRPLLRDLEEGPVHSDVTEIQAAAERAAALTRQLLTFSRRQAAAVQTIDLNATVQNLDGLLRSLLGEDVELLFELDPGAGSVEIDPHQFEQVVMNLAVNARDAMPDGGSLRLSTRSCEIDAVESRRLGLDAPGTYAAFSASDTGCGIDEDIRAHLFEPFFTTKDPGKGTGLGLSIVYGVVEQAGGTIVVSAEPNKGSSFEIYLPRGAETAVTDEPSTPLVETVGAAHILVVDDEPSVRRVARQLLERAGHRVSEAGDGREAIHLCTTGSDPPALVLTDLVMPRLSGEALAIRLRWLLPGVKVLFMSGYPRERTSDLAAPVTPVFLQKPFAEGELVAQVARALGAED